MTILGNRDGENMTTVNWISGGDVKRSSKRLMTQNEPATVEAEANTQSCSQACK